jgi:hypothetical protein
VSEDGSSAKPKKPSATTPPAAGKTTAAGKAKPADAAVETTTKRKLQTPAPARPPQVAGASDTAEFASITSDPDAAQEALAARSTTSAGAAAGTIPSAPPAIVTKASMGGRYAALILVGLVVQIILIVVAAVPHQSSGTSPDYDSGANSSSYGTLPEGGSEPPCPDGSSAVMWSEWDGGATVVCRVDDGSGYSMIVWSQASAEQSNDVTVTPAGYSSPLAQIAFDGWMVWTQDSDQSVASTSWGTGGSNSAGNGATAESGIPACPSDSYPISLSVWNGGWLLTCGTSSSDMSSFSYQDGSEASQGGELEAAGDGYCGTTDDGVQVCVNSAPALVQIGTGTSTVQLSVASNYFAGAGVGGAGQGTGAYDVDTPNDTATAQVNYLVEILEKSASARSEVKSVLQPLNACSVTNEDVQSLTDLTQARTDLLNAVQSTPVDQVPDGATLLARLKYALSLSEQADEGYVSAGSTMASGDCSDGKASYRSALAIATRAEQAKQAFIQLWNDEISAQFSVRTFTAKDI